MGQHPPARLLCLPGSVFADIEGPIPPDRASLSHTHTNCQTRHAPHPNAMPQVPSPFKPTIKSIDSVENFDTQWTDLPPQVSPGLLVAIRWTQQTAKRGGGNGVAHTKRIANNFHELAAFPPPPPPKFDTPHTLPHVCAGLALRHPPRGIPLRPHVRGLHVLLRVVPCGSCKCRRGRPGAGPGERCGGRRGGHATSATAAAHGQHCRMRAPECSRSSGSEDPHGSSSDGSVCWQPPHPGHLPPAGSGPSRLSLAGHPMLRHIPGRLTASSHHLLFIV